MKQFALNYEIKKDNNLHYIKDWIRNLQVCIKNFEVHGEEDVRRYLGFKSKIFEKEK